MQPTETSVIADTDAHIERVTAIVAAFVTGNTVRSDELAGLISSVSLGLKGLETSAVPEVIPQEPAVNPKKSISADYIICLEDGKKYKSLKRHLAKLGMTPDQYRAKWGLDKDYPMVAPSYSEARSNLAKTAGLGRKRSEQVVAPPESTFVEAVAAQPGIVIGPMNSGKTGTETIETPAAKAPKAPKSKNTDVETAATTA